MAQQSKRDTSDKQALHPRNLHRSRYDLELLGKACPELYPHILVNTYGALSVDFSDPQAVKALNKALLKVYYGISGWDIPAGYLCPPVPGRADYIHYAADILAACNNGMVPTGGAVNVLDTGTGANCIYPLIGNAAYGWTFTGSDIDPQAIASAKKIIAGNKQLTGRVSIRLQSNKDRIFKGIIQKEEHFDLTVCNPPFHASAAEAQAGTARKQRNLGQKKKSPLNFGGQGNELWCDGGEREFVTRMIRESVAFAGSCLWFSSLISKSDSLKNVYNVLGEIKAAGIKTIGMAQGSKSSRIVAWTFLGQQEQEKWKKEHWTSGGMK